MFIFPLIPIHSWQSNIIADFGSFLKTKAMLTLSSYRNIIAIYAVLLITTVLVCDHPRHDGSSVKANNQDISFAGTDKALLNRHLKQFVDHYIEKNGDCLYGIRQRSSSPFDLIDSIFNHYELPIQLKYLAVIESELKTTALSRVGAAGPWQLMPETAQLLGLKVSSNCDERLSYGKSTRAAARYLKDLHAEFGDWLLVLAAYNGGSGPVYSAMRQSGSKRFWILQRFLPQETREYVKKFMATYYYFEGPGCLATVSRA